MNIQIRARRPQFLGEDRQKPWEVRLNDLDCRGPATPGAGRLPPRLVMGPRLAARKSAHTGIESKGARTLVCGSAGWAERVG